MDLCKETKAGECNKNGVQEAFGTENGLKQGCVCFPTFFSLFVNEMPESVGGGK